MARTRDGTLARKRFGQHFLVDRAVLSATVAAIDPRPEQRLIEIGPGHGALTAPLIAAVAAATAAVPALTCAPVLEAIEIDRDLAPVLQARFGANLLLHRADVLGFDFGGGRPPRLVGNLPYNISSALLLHVSAWADHVVDQHFMLQREVANRVVAEPGPDLGRLTVALQNRYQVQRLFDVGPDAFDPPPRVWSSLIRMRPRPQPLTRQVALLETLLTVAFGQRRKMLRATLWRWLSERFAPHDVRAVVDAEPLLEPLRDGTRRPESIAVQSWCALADRLGQLAPTDSQ